jgi:yeast amino acid transporter
MSIKTSSGAVFTYINDFGGTAAYIAWASITFVQLRVRAAAQAQGIDRKTFPFVAPGGSWVYWLNFAFNIFILLIQGYASLETPFNYKTFIACYISLPLFFVMFFGYKLCFKTKW